MKNFLTITLAGVAAVSLIGLIVTGIKYQQAVSEVERLKNEHTTVIDQHWNDMQDKAKKAK